MTSFDRRQFIAVSSAAAAVPLLIGAKASPPANLEHLRRQAIDLTSGKVPSLSLAVLHHGRPVWVEAFGWSDLERRTRASVDTRYAIASATKPFTATVVLGLLKQNGIGVDEAIGPYLPGIEIGRSPGSPPITFRELFQHHSGIPRHWRNSFAGQAGPAPFEEVANRHAFATPARGRRYLYSNLNYGLLARAAEHISGLEFSQLRHQSLLRPLGIASATPLQDQFEHWTAAIPYEEDRSSIPPYLVDEKGARDLVMTARDLARFGQAHLAGHPTLDPALRKRMVTERAAIEIVDATRPYYGLGWIVDEDSPAALFSFGHTGEGPGAASSLTIVPSEQLVVATVANGQGAPAYMLNAAIVDAFSPAFAARRKAHPFQVANPDPKASAPFDGEWAGQLATPDSEMPVRMTVNSGGSSRLSVANVLASLDELDVDFGVLSAKADARIPTPEAQAWPHSMRLHVERTAYGLEGTLAAFASRGKIAHEQFWLSYKLRLRSGSDGQAATAAVSRKSLS